MTVHSNYIHISQVPEMYEGVSTNNADLNYQLKKSAMNRQECLDYLHRKITQLKNKLQLQEAAAGHKRRWSNQLEFYESILKYLSLPKHF